MHDHISNVNNILRNKNRVLNYLPYAKSKVEIINSLKLNVPQNFSILSKVKRGEISSQEAVKILAERTQVDYNIIETMLLNCYSTGLLEFHITDVCDLDCIDCHYRNKSNATMQFSYIEEYIRNLNPRSITITGGGEPNCYNSEGKGISDVVELIHLKFPNIKIGLINNNTIIPLGDWINHLSWQRSSVDADCAETYKLIKRRDKYNACINNIYELLNSNIPHIGIGFLFREENIFGMKAFILDWHERWINMDDNKKKKLNLQFRPISPSIEKIESYDVTSDLEIKTSKTFQEIINISMENSSLRLFLLNQTNFFNIAITNIRDSYYLHKPNEFTHCYNALLHRVLRSDGNEFPDFLLCNDSSMSLGNILTSKHANWERIKIALNTFYFYNCIPKQFCKSETCRQGWVSQLIEKNWNANISKEEIPKDYFF